MLPPGKLYHHVIDRIMERMNLGHNWTVDYSGEDGPEALAMPGAAASIARCVWDTIEEAGYAIVPKDGTNDLHSDGPANTMGRPGEITGKRTSSAHSRVRIPDAGTGTP